MTTLARPNTMRVAAGEAKRASAAIANAAARKISAATSTRRWFVELMIFAASPDRSTWGAKRQTPRMARTKALAPNSDTATNGMANSMMPIAK